MLNKMNGFQKSCILFSTPEHLLHTYSQFGFRAYQFLITCLCPASTPLHKFFDTFFYSFGFSFADLLFYYSREQDGKANKFDDMKDLHCLEVPIVTQKLFKLLHIH